MLKMRSCILQSTDQRSKLSEKGCNRTKRNQAEVSNDAIGERQQQAIQYFCSGSVGEVTADLTQDDHNVKKIDSNARYRLEAIACEKFKFSTCFGFQSELRPNVGRSASK